MKLCPECRKPSDPDAWVCSCGHQYQTQFTVPEPTRPLQPPLQAPALQHPAVHPADPRTTTLAPGAHVPISGSLPGPRGRFLPQSSVGLAVIAAAILAAGILGAVMALALRPNPQPAPPVVRPQALRTGTAPMTSQPAAPGTPVQPGLTGPQATSTDNPSAPLSDAAARIAGTWRFTGNVAGTPFTDTFSFNSDGTGFDTEGRFTWTVRADIISIVSGGIRPIRDRTRFLMSEDGKSMMWTFPDSPNDFSRGYSLLRL